MQILWRYCSGMFLWTPYLISSKRSFFFLTGCSRVNFDNIYTIIYTLRCGFCWNWVVLTFWRCSLWYWYNVFRPNMTYKVDWVLKANYLLTYLLPLPLPLSSWGDLMRLTGRQNPNSLSLSLSLSHSFSLSLSLSFSLSPRWWLVDRNWLRL